MSRLDERRERILTTHTGSLPRPDALSALLFARMTRKPYDAGELARLTTEAVAATVKTQADLGIDIVSDGEQSKTSFQAYAADRLSGIEPITAEPGERRTRENIAFPAFYVGGAHSGSARPRWACTGPIKYAGHDALAADLQNLKRALQGIAPADVFMPSVSPSSCAGFMENRHYKSDEEHVFAVAEAMREEYEAIVAAGFQVQIDDPRLAMHYMLTPAKTSTRRAPGRGGGSKHSITRCATSRRSACGIIPATASTWARASATWS
jgi:5-methyltetrahydropteroyltriglutamate--homocysteine methyltransferase